MYRSVDDQSTPITVDHADTVGRAEDDRFASARAKRWNQEDPAAGFLGKRPQMLR
jgi:hypothetical protein